MAPGPALRVRQRPAPVHSPAAPRPAAPCRRARVAAGAGARERKDPAQFASMDAARDYLHAQAGGRGGPIAGLLNWLSESAFGRGKVGGRAGRGGGWQALAGPLGFSPAAPSPRPTHPPKNPPSKPPPTQGGLGEAYKRWLQAQRTPEQQRFERRAAAE
jgi:hypothetical protein